MEEKAEPNVFLIECVDCCSNFDIWFLSCLWNVYFCALPEEKAAAGTLFRRVKGGTCWLQIAFFSLHPHPTRQ
jgi:hypothetical protein